MAVKFELETRATCMPGSCAQADDQHAHTDSSKYQGTISFDVSLLYFWQHQWSSDDHDGPVSKSAPQGADCTKVD
jgi:hypothetical protein